MHNRNPSTRQTTDSHQGISTSILHSPVFPAQHFANWAHLSSPEDEFLMSGAVLNPWDSAMRLIIGHCQYPPQLQQKSSYHIAKHD
jgi:hypothetical protein